MLATLRLASKARAASLLVPLCRFPIYPPRVEVFRLQQQTFCYDRSSRPKSKVCSKGKTGDSRSKGKGKEGDDSSKKTSVDPCQGKGRGDASKKKPVDPCEGRADDSSKKTSVDPCEGKGADDSSKKTYVDCCKGKVGDDASKKTPGDRSKDKGEDDASKNTVVDCCKGKRGDDDAFNKKDIGCGKGKSASDNIGSKAQTVVCDESQDKFAKGVAGTQEMAEDSGKESDVEEDECSEVEEEDETKAPTKDCSDDELSEESSSDDEKPGKPASEMCDCVKAAVAKAIDEKSKPKSEKCIENQGPGSIPKEAAAKPKMSKNVGCCEVETGKSASQTGGEPSGVERCKAFKKEANPTEDLKESGKDDSKKVHKKNQPCECIKQALEKCKKGAKTPPPQIPQKPDKKKSKEKPNVDKKADKAPDRPKPEKKPDTKKPDKKPEKDKPDPKPGPKGKTACEKKKRPVVKCK